ncbi:MAG: methyltransferase family protein [Acidimicrobiales bacterium]
MIGVVRAAWQSHTLGGVAFYLTLAVWIGLEVRQAGRTRENATRTDRHSRFAVAIGEILGWSIAINGPRIAPGLTWSGSAWVVVGLTVWWCGIALRAWSFQTLGRYFTFVVMTSEDQPVIEAGPYRWVRHPSYLAIELCMIGVGLTFSNALSLIGASVATLVGLIVRIRVEETALRAALGERYDDFCRSRRRLVPFVW